jgi:protein phosphatase 1G
MGAYLSEPITDKVSTDEVGKRVICGASSMQGWRVTQEVGFKVACDCKFNLPGFELGLYFVTIVVRCLVYK